MRLRVDVCFNVDDVDNMMCGLKGFVKHTIEKAEESKETTTFWIPLGKITVSLEENPILED